MDNSEFDHAIEHEVKEQIENLWMREEIYWKQYSCIKWLNHGDFNTWFFHVTVLDRRRQSKVLKCNGDWLPDELVILRDCKDSSARLFVSDDQTDWEGVLDSLLRLIIEATNN